MGEEFHAVIKLITGEEIFALVSVDENDGDPIIMLQSPVVMKMMHNPTGEYVKIRPWLEIPTDDLYLIKYDRIYTGERIRDIIDLGNGSILMSLESTGSFGILENIY